MSIFRENGLNECHKLRSRSLPRYSLNCQNDFIHADIPRIWSVKCADTIK